MYFTFSQVYLLYFLSQTFITPPPPDTTLFWSFLAKNTINLYCKRNYQEIYFSLFLPNFSSFSNIFFQTFTSILQYTLHKLYSPSLLFFFFNKEKEISFIMKRYNCLRCTLVGLPNNLINKLYINKSIIIYKLNKSIALLLP